MTRTHSSTGKGQGAYCKRVISAGSGSRGSAPAGLSREHLYCYHARLRVGRHFWRGRRPIPLGGVSLFGAHRSECRGRAKGLPGNNPMTHRETRGRAGCDGRQRRGLREGSGSVRGGTKRPFPNIKDIVRERGLSLHRPKGQIKYRWRRTAGHAREGPGHPAGYPGPDAYSPLNLSGTNCSVW